MGILLAVWVLALPLAAAADGAGGMFMGYQTPASRIIGQSDIASAIPSTELGLVCFGGYGYGVGRDRWVNGGFGMAFLDSQENSRISGGVGGFISGFRLMRIPIHVALVSWTGVGGLYTGAYAQNPEHGYFAVLQEIDLEVGLPLARWFMPTLYLGYQVVGNFVPGMPFQEFFSYTPVAGVRVAWGSFR